MFRAIFAKFARKQAAPTIAKVESRPQWLIDFDAKSRAYSARVKADNATYKAEKPARVLAAMQRLVDAGELESIAARYGKTDSDIAKARAHLVARGVTFN